VESVEDDPMKGGLEVLLTDGDQPDVELWDNELVDEKVVDAQAV